METEDETINEGKIDALSNKVFKVICGENSHLIVYSLLYVIQYVLRQVHEDNHASAISEYMEISKGFVEHWKASGSH